MNGDRTGNSHSVSTEELLAGIPVTEEGRRRARAKLDEARARHTPERSAKLRAQVGLPPEERAA